MKDCILSSAAKSCCVAAFSVVLLSLSQTGFSDNGSIAEAWPVESISIDGNLSDWPATIPRYPIAIEYHGAPFPVSSDLKASFRTGYNLAEKSVYVALEIDDQDHRPHDPSKDEEFEWSEHDSVVLYIDSTHAPRGSGPQLFCISGNTKEIIGGKQAWDPVAAKASWDQVEVSVSRAGQSTIYEWKLQLDGAVQPGRVLGFDLLLSDKDGVDDDEEDPASLAMWGLLGQKSQGTHRLGDLVLCDPKAVNGKLVGKVEWDQGNVPKYKRKVRVISKERPGYWLQVLTDEEGNYDVEVPVGEYEISYPYITFGSEFSEFKRLDESVSVVANVEAGAVSRAEPLKIVVEEAPNLLQDKGILAEYEPGDEAQVDEFIKTYMDYFAVPGVSVALVKDGKRVYYKTFGVKNYYTQEPVGPDTLFEAASITKIVFAFLVNKMAERGEIDLDRPLCEYLPFKAIEHDDRYRLITARHSLTHRTGFPNWAYMNDDGKIDIKAYPGTKKGYSGEGFEYLGRVVTKIYNQLHSGDSEVASDGTDDSTTVSNPDSKALTLEEILRKEVLRPMGFDENTHFSENDQLQAVCSRGHNSNRTAASYLPGEIGVAHSMHTEAKTFSNFLIALLNKENLSEQGYKAMFQPAVWYEWHDGYHGPKWDQYFGLGFHLIDTPWGMSFGHGGNNGDFMCLTEAFPEKNCGWVMFTNSDHGQLLHEQFRLFLTHGKFTPEKDED